jgi:hypothetical protein
MAFQFKLPDIGEGIAEGEIVKWFVKPGDTINEDDTLLEVQNDKSVEEIPISSYRYSKKYPSIRRNCCKCWGCISRNRCTRT